MAKKERDYDEIARLYNEYGSVTAKQFISDTYGIKHPEYILRKMKDAHGYTYNAALKSYELQEKKEDMALFLGLEELCQPEKLTALPIKGQASINSEIGDLFHDLMEDRFLELSRYIHLKQSSREIVINQTALKSAGYQVAIY